MTFKEALLGFSTGDDPKKSLRAKVGEKGGGNSGDNAGEILAPAKS